MTASGAADDVLGDPEKLVGREHLYSVEVTGLISYDLTPWLVLPFAVAFARQSSITFGSDDPPGIPRWPR